MIKEAIDRLLQLKEVQKLDISGRPYTSAAIIPVADPTPGTIEVGTLTGLSDYIKANVDALTAAELMIHIKAFDSVVLLSKFGGSWAERHKYISAKAPSIRFPFGSFMEVEQFIIGVQSMFVQDEQTTGILRVVGNVKDGIVKEFSDDGVSQKVTAKAGVSRVEEVPVPNPAILAPFRTFMEIEQPASKFVFRMRSGECAPTCALFEADGGVWKNEAMARIKEWLADKVNGVTIIA